MHDDDERGQEPGQLVDLDPSAAWRPGRAAVVDLRTMEAHRPDAEDALESRRLATLGPADAKRVRALLRAETGAWTADQPATGLSYLAEPRLVLQFRYFRQDAHGAARGLQQIDIATRRAAATLENYYLGEQMSGWARPLRPERGGVWLINSQIGSFEVVASVYGSLITLATSAPISLASLISLAWDASRTALRAGRWVIRKIDGTGRAASPDGEWGYRHTKELAPVMQAAANGGQGVEFVHNYEQGEIRLTVYPKKG